MKKIIKTTADDLLLHLDNRPGDRKFVEGVLINLVKSVRMNNRITKNLFPYKQYNGWHFRYYIFFVEEGIMNSEYKDYTAGRCEVRVDEEQYSIREYRYLTKKKSFYKFRNSVECHYYNIIGLLIIKMILKYYYNKK